MAGRAGTMAPYKSRGRPEKNPKRLRIQRLKARGVRYSKTSKWPVGPQTSGE